MTKANPELPKLTGADMDHAAGIWAMWHDPSMYDPLVDGPPYLPAPKRAAPVTASVGKESDEKAALAILSQILQTTSAAYQNAPMAELAVLLAFLRAEAIIYQAHHWQTRGMAFYGDHQMYDRLYGDVQELIDRLAERVIGSGHHLLGQPILHTVQTAVLVRVLYGDAPTDPSPEEYALLSLRMVHRFLALHRMVYFILDERGQLSHGTDNLLQDIADKHEDHVYLLRQRTTKTATYDRRP